MRQMPLWYRRRVVTVALVDDEDFDWLSEWRWSTHYVHWMSDDWGYAYRSGFGGSYAMARQIMGVPPGDPRVVHHANEIRLDNRRENLVVCSSVLEHLGIPHSRRPVHRRAVPRQSLPYSVSWSRELFEEAPEEATV